MVEARVDVLIQLLTFQNIDLLRRGVYRLFICLQQPSSSDTLVYAAPLPLQGRHCSSERNPQFKPGVSGHFYFTQAFPIKYSEEAFNFQELPQFRAQGSFSSSSSGVIKLELMYYNVDDLDDITSTTSFSSGELIATQTVAVHSLLEGVIEQTKICFSGRNPCAVTLNVFSLISSVKVANTRILANYLFQDSKGTPRKLVGAEEANDTQELYVGTMKAMYHKFYDFLSLLKHELRSENSQAAITRMSTYVGRQDSLLFSERLASHQPAKIVEELISELAIWTSRLIYLKEELLSTIEEAPRRLVKELRRRLYEKTASYIENSLIRHVSDMSLLNLYRPTTRTAERIEFIKAQRRAFALRQAAEISGVTSGYTKPLKDSAIVFVDEFMAPSYSRKALDCRPSRHLFVFVNGYKGRPADMNSLKGALLMYQPRVQTLSSEANVDRSDDDIGVQGERLACEVMTYIADAKMKHKLQRLSFIGHSMGGLVIRAALPLLSDLSSKMHCLITFNSPHLGFVEQSSAFIDTGIWLASIFQPQMALSQISMQDSQTISDSFLMRLSQYQGLEWFTHVFLVGSHQDSYTPVESALVEIPETVSTGAYAVMAKRILSQVQHLYRLDVSYKLNKGLMDQLTGRAAHVEVIMDEHLMRTVMHSFTEEIL
jgi:hypothetical protein